MDEKEIIETLKDHEERLKRLEEKRILVQPKRKEKVSFFGISKGVYELIKEGFFDIPRKIEEIILELERKGFFGRRDKIDSSIRKTFFGTKKLLDRMKKGGSWRYFKRK